jgi:hypothetical protein
MRLLKTRTAKLEFEEFWSVNTPLYAILSHTWGEGEVTYQDVQRGNPSPRKAGYAKVKETRAIAAAYGFDYVWIDTCCIDKASSSELSEAINSMYDWYRKSTICFAYLADVLPCPSSSSSPYNPEFLEKSKWFSRGWTLQELIAPSIIVFFNQEWQKIGSKSSLEADLSRITDIPPEVLQSCDPSTSSIARRMSWASHRQTTRVEDTAYCLMGIFGINMPMLYGEGERAFLRLQEEILKISDDHTIFAWETRFLSQSDDHYPSLLAPSPAVFDRKHNAFPLASSDPLVGAITVDNKGIHLTVQVLDHHEDDTTRVLLPCMVKISGHLLFVGLVLRSVSMSETGSSSSSSSFLVTKNSSSFGNGEKFFVKAKNVLLTVRGEEIEESKKSNKWFDAHICIQRTRQAVRHFPLAEVARQGDATMMERMLENGASMGNSQLLHVAATHGHEALVSFLLDWGVRPDLRVLQGAVENGHLGVTRLLLNRGVQPGVEVLSWCYSNEKMARLLPAECGPSGFDPW